MNEQTFTLAELVSFGNYLLSEQRNKSVTNEQSKHLVGDWDIANWEETQKTHARNDDSINDYFILPACSNDVVNRIHTASQVR